MKVRSGFVSNSRSSSFIVGCSSTPLNRAQAVEYLETNPRANTLVVGAALSEGDDIFFLDSKKVDFILDH